LVFFAVGRCVHLFVPLRPLNCLASADPQRLCLVGVSSRGLVVVVVVVVFLGSRVWTVAGCCLLPLVLPFVALAGLLWQA
jgi:hypothetical protein